MNPDGYAVNVAAWEGALLKAAKHGYICRDARAGASAGSGALGGKGDGGGRVKSSHLVLRANESLVRELEVPELGQPVALSTVFVCLLG